MLGMSTFPPPTTNMADTQNKDALADLTDASRGFDSVFDDNLDDARAVFSARDSPYHLLGIAALSFLEAALSFEVFIASRQMNICHGYNTD